MQGDGLIGISFQYLVIDAFGLRQVTLRVMLYGKVQRLLDVWCVLLLRHWLPHLQSSGVP